ncbi:MAG: hypothetical protein AAFO91_08770, partial [Bacteroidota bacterium]
MSDDNQMWAPSEEGDEHLPENEEGQKLMNSDEASILSEQIKALRLQSESEARERRDLTRKYEQSLAQHAQATQELSRLRQLMQLNSQNPPQEDADSTESKSAGSTLAESYFANRPRRPVDVDYAARKREWMQNNYSATDISNLEKLAAAGKGDRITFSGNDRDWPEFRARFRASLQAARIIEVAEGVVIDYRLDSAIYSRVIDAVTGTTAADHIETNVAFGDGPSAWATLCSRFDLRTAERIPIIEDDIRNTKLANGGDLNDHLARMARNFQLLEDCGEPLSERV